MSNVGNFGFTGASEHGGIHEFLGPWINIPIRYKENFDYETMLNKIICCLIFSVKWKEGKNPINDFL